MFKFTKECCWGIVTRRKANLQLTLAFVRLYGNKKANLPKALNICIPPYFPSNRTVLLSGLKARHILTKTTSKQPVGHQKEHDSHKAFAQKILHRKILRHLKAFFEVKVAISKKKNLLVNKN